MNAKQILEVYERFKHLDTLLSDESWMFDDDQPKSPMRHYLYDLWAAIKQAVER